MTSELDALLGREIDGYSIDKLLGKGGMARVYRGQDIRLGRYVAVKFIEPTAHADPEFTSRFQKEARAIAQLNHPHIVSIYRFGEDNGLFYMVMQYIDGADLGWALQDFAQDGELMQHEDVLRVVSHIGSALDYAHSKGVIHRDVKPSNVMLNKDGSAILTDFGLALVQAEGTQGKIFGTPHYIAPEQAVSSAGVLPQSDQYSLGIMLYEMLTGSLPYTGKSAMDIALAHMSETLPPPLERNPDLHPAFVPVLERVLQKEPEGRYPSCAALTADLERALQAQKRQPTTLSRVSIVAIPEQVEAFRLANPLPPLPAGVQIPAVPSEIKTPPFVAETQQATPAITVRRPTNQRQMWTMVLVASIVIACAGLIAVTSLISANNRNQLSAATEANLINLATSTPLAIPSSTANLPSPIPALPSATSLAAPTVQSFTLVPNVATSVPALPAATESATTYLLLIVRHREDSLFVLNVTEQDFPLSPLRLGNDQGAIYGSEWGVSTLTNGSCVAAWKDSGNPKAPNVICSEVGEHLTRGGHDRFWKSSFNVYYNEQQVGTCDQDVCPITITGQT